MASTVTLINPFEIPRGQEILFLQHWKKASEFLSRQEGFISTRLQRSNNGRTRFRFTNIAVWESRHHFLQAVKAEEFQHILTELDLSHFSRLFDLLLEDSGGGRQTVLH